MDFPFEQIVKGNILVRTFDLSVDSDELKWHQDLKDRKVTVIEGNGWLFQMENEIRKKVPMIYLNIWDDLPAPLYNKSYYESCDTLMAISKQTLNINKLVLGDKAADKILTYIPHGINEKITKENYKEIILFSYHLIKRINS